MKLEREKIIPHLRQEKKVNLVPTSGRVISIRDFVKQNVACLTNLEIGIVRKAGGLLSNSVPKLFPQPVIISSAESLGKEALAATAIGSRSVYLVKDKLKLKGCKPIKDLYFPHEKLDFGDQRMTTKKISFGSLSAENVMRELLAYCFFKSNKMPILHSPACVFEYDLQGDKTYCLVSKTPSELRLESKEDFYGFTLRDLIRHRMRVQELKIDILPKEERFKKITMGWYTQEKAAVLAKMNAHGGFRGILNSNLGNDLVYKKKFYICDFDTFKVIPIPEKPSPRFIDNFILWSMAELLKSSPFILEYVDIEGMPKVVAAKKLWRIYSESSSLWKNYWPNLMKDLKTWDRKEIARSLKKNLRHGVIHDLILDSMLNSAVLKNTYQPEMSFYVPHNY